MISFFKKYLVVHKCGNKDTQNGDQYFLVILESMVSVRKIWNLWSLRALCKKIYVIEEFSCYKSKFGY